MDARSITTLIITAIIFTAIITAALVTTGEAALPVAVAVAAPAGALYSAGIAYVSGAFKR